MIIALGHRQGVGKDQCASLLKNSGVFGEVEICSFAEFMKEKCHELFADLGMQRPDHYETHREEKNEILPLIHKTPREIMIEYGMSMRAIWENVWVYHAMKRCTESDILYVFTDLRFPNEFKAVKNRGGFCIRVDRPSIDVHNDVADEALAPLNIGEWDAICYNCGDLLELSKNIHQAVEDLS